MKLTGELLFQIGKAFPLHLQDPEEYLRLKVSGMTFDIRAFRVKGLGHVSCMTATGFFGLMKMDTVIIVPTEVDMPLYSYDRILAMGNDTLIFELYDTFLESARLTALDQVKGIYEHLPEHDLGAHWYDSIKLSQSLSKKGKKQHRAEFDRCAIEYTAAYLAAAQAAPHCDGDAKRKKASVYVEGLLTHGGPSTDVFKKGIGEEKTAELFRKVLFATE